MRIAIVTLPLHTNYGGLLQAYALKAYLEGMGHEATVLDLKVKMPGPPALKAPFVYVRRMLNVLVKGEGAPEVFRERRFKFELPVVGFNTDTFINKYISPRLLDSFGQVSCDDYDAFVVGSDQVWRPKYFPNVENAFLAFTKDWDVKRVAYAASFGTSELEYENPLLERCSSLLKKFDAVSVREASGVKMCEEWFDRDDAVHVLDPVMLLEADAYSTRTPSAVTPPRTRAIRLESSGMYLRKMPMVPKITMAEVIFNRADAAGDISDRSFGRQDQV